MATEKRAECKEKDTRLHYERYILSKWTNSKYCTIAAKVGILVSVVLLLQK